MTNCIESRLFFDFEIARCFSFATIAASTYLGPDIALRKDGLKNKIHSVKWKFFCFYCTADGKTPSRNSKSPKLLFATSLARPLSSFLCSRLLPMSGSRQAGTAAGGWVQERDIELSDLSAPAPPRAATAPINGGTTLNGANTAKGPSRLSRISNVGASIGGRVRFSFFWRNLKKLIFSGVCRTGKTLVQPVLEFLGRSEREQNQIPSLCFHHPRNSHRTRFVGFVSVLQRLGVGSSDLSHTSGEEFEDPWRGMQNCV